MTKRTALVVGATGLVGSQVLKTLLASDQWSKVIAVTRRPCERQSPKLVNVVVDFDDLHKVARKLKADDAFCCLGTTMRQVGSRTEFHKVDYGYAMALAQLLKDNGSEHFLLLTALGAARNSLFFYNMVKGRLEDDVRKLDFPALSVFHPSLLLGDRQEMRAAEQLAGKLFALVSPVLLGPLQALRPVSATMVARAMVGRALEWRQLHSPDYGLYAYPDIVRFSNELPIDDVKESK